MAFLKTSDSIIIRATLTEKGRKLMSRGKFKIAKFSLGDDEIDYSLYSASEADVSDKYLPGLLNTFSFEAYGDRLKNIQYGLNSYDAGVLYLPDEEIERMAPDIHAAVYWLPVLAKNDLLSMSPTWRDSVYYVSVNEETTSKIRDGISSFKFLESNNLENCKIIIESGIKGQNPAADDAPPPPTLENRKDYILKKFLLDQDFFINADDRLIRKIASITPKSKFQSFASGEHIIQFETLSDVSPISLENQFPNYASYVVRGINNMVADYDYVTDSTTSTRLSALDGPRGSVFAFNVMVDDELKVNSTGERDFRYKKFGKINQIVFPTEMPTSKFDYVDTTIYIYGGTTNSRILVPVRLIRYAGI